MNNGSANTNTIMRKGGIVMKGTTKTMSSEAQGEFTKVTWNGGRQGDLIDGTWHGGRQGDLDGGTWHGGRQGDLDGGTWHGNKERGRASNVIKLRKSKNSHGIEKDLVTIFMNKM